MSYSGKIPYTYDKNSKTYQMGAYRNWPNNDPSCSASRRLAEQDKSFLEQQRSIR